MNDQSAAAASSSSSFVEKPEKDVSVDEESWKIPFEKLFGANGMHDLVVASFDLAQRVAENADELKGYPTLSTAIDYIKQFHTLYSKQQEWFCELVGSAYRLLAKNNQQFLDDVLNPITIHEHYEFLDEFIRQILMSRVDFKLKHKGESYYEQVIEAKGDIESLRRKQETEWRKNNPDLEIVVYDVDESERCSRTLARILRRFTAEKCDRHDSKNPVRLYEPSRKFSVQFIFKALDAALKYSIIGNDTPITRVTNIVSENETASLSIDELQWRYELTAHSYNLLQYLIKNASDEKVLYEDFDQNDMLKQLKPLLIALKSSHGFLRDLCSLLDTPNVLRSGDFIFNPMSLCYDIPAQTSLIYDIRAKSWNDKKDESGETV